MAHRGRTPRIAKLRRKGDLDGLKRAAAYTDVLVTRNGELLDRGASIRAEALRGLSDFYGNDVVEVLTTGLRDENGDVRYAAVEGLGKIHSSAAHSALLEFLAEGAPDESRVIRALALKLLCESGRQGLAERWATRTIAARRGSLTEEDRQDFLALKASDERPHGTQRVFDALSRHLRSEAADDHARELAETILSWCGHGPLFGLEDMLREMPVSNAVVRVAGGTGDQRLIEPLTRLLADERPTTRRLAVSALGELRDTRAVIPLLRATRDDDYEVRDQAMAALDSLGSAGVTVAVTMLMQASLEGGGAGGSDSLGQGGWTEQAIGRLVGGNGPDAATGDST